MTGARPASRGEAGRGAGLPALAARLDARTTILLLDVLIFAAFAAALPDFATPRNLLAVLAASLPLLLLASGQTFVLTGAGIDLSATATVGLASVAGGLLMSADGGWLGGHPLASAAGVAAMLAVGAAVGLANGLPIARLGMPAFMVTLTVGMFVSGLAVWLPRIVADTETLFALPGSFTALGGITTLAGAIAITCAAGAHGLLAGTAYGRRLQATGCNPRAALVSGVPVVRIVAASYVISGVLAAVAAILMTGSLETASPTHGRTLLLDVIGATVIGGTSLSGGRGDVAGTALGVLFLALLGNGLTLLNMSDFAITIVKGLVILAAALLDVARRRGTGGP